MSLFTLSDCLDVIFTTIAFSSFLFSGSKKAAGINRRRIALYFRILSLTYFNTRKFQLLEEQRNNAKTKSVTHTQAIENTAFL